jgi:hypothetical protein
MPATRVTRPKVRTALIGASVADPATDRALTDAGDAIARLEASGTRSAVVRDFAIGSNRVPHGLGRKPRGASLTPTVADAAFAWAMASADERFVVINVIGAAQPGACLELY